MPDRYSYSYDTTYEEYRLPGRDGFYGNVLTGGQDREYYERVYKYWRVKYGRYGNEISRVEIKRESFIDFDAWGALSGVKQKTRFEKPTGFGKFATEWADAWSNVSISIGGSINGPRDNGENDSFFIVHPNVDDPTDIVSQLSGWERERDNYFKAKLAVNNALRQYRASLPEFNRNRVEVQQPIDESINILTPIEGDVIQVEQLVFASSSDVLVYDPGLMNNINEIYKRIADDNIEVSIISERNGAYLTIGDVVTADYIQSFATDAIDIEPGSYRLIDIDIIDVNDVDWLGNQYDDPEMIKTSMPALNALMYLRRVSEN